MSKTRPTQVQNTHDTCIFKNSSHVHVSCPSNIAWVYASFRFLMNIKNLQANNMDGHMGKNIGTPLKIRCKMPQEKGDKGSL